jgi:hypothetical protein
MGRIFIINFSDGFNSKYLTGDPNSFQSHGGHIPNGLKVRIKHVDNVIIKIEVSKLNFPAASCGECARFCGSSSALKS